MKYNNKNQQSTLQFTEHFHRHTPFLFLHPHVLEQELLSHLGVKTCKLDNGYTGTQMVSCILGHILKADFVLNISIKIIHTKFPRF